MNKTIPHAYIALFVAALIWGATVPIMKVTLAHIPIFTLAFLRFGLASLILYPFVKHELAIHKKDFLMILMAGILGISIHIPLFFFGLSNTNAMNAGILFAAAPLFTFVTARIFLKEKITSKMVLGALIGFTGIVIITLQDVLQGVSFSPGGDFLILLSTLTFVISEVFTKKLTKVYPAKTVTFYALFIGGVSFFPLALFEYTQDPSWVTTIPLEAVGGLLYGIIFSSFAAYTLWQWALSLIDASRVVFFLYLDPIITTALAVVLLGEHITPYFVAGTCFIILGLLIANRKSHHPLHKVHS